MHFPLQLLLNNRNLYLAYIIQNSRIQTQWSSIYTEKNYVFGRFYIYFPFIVSFTINSRSYICFSFTLYDQLAFRAFRYFFFVYSSYVFTIWNIDIIFVWFYFSFFPLSLGNGEMIKLNSCLWMKWLTRKLTNSNSFAHVGRSFFSVKILVKESFFFLKIVICALVPVSLVYCCRCNTFTP